MLASQQGITALSLEMETDGRSLNPEGLDLARTAGCFISLSAVELELKDIYDQDSALKSIKEQLRRKQTAGSGRAQVLFSYFDPPQAELCSRHFPPMEDSRPARTSAVFPHPLQLACRLTRGCLEMQWSFDERVHDASAVQKFAEVFSEQLKNLVQHCVSSDGSAYSPSDFPEAEVNQEELDKFLDLLGKSSGGGL
jgi:non-ribosomal peptide synthase protein (TIGR01720 family)